MYNILDSFSLLPPWAYKLWARSTFWGLSWGKLVFGWEKTLKKTSELLSNSVFWAKSSMVRWKTLCRHLKRGHCKVTPEWRMIQLRMPRLHYSWRHEPTRFLALTNMKDLNYTRLHLDWLQWSAVNAAWMSVSYIYAHLRESLFLYRCVRQHDTHQMWLYGGLHH